MKMTLISSGLALMVCLVAGGCASNRNFIAAASSENRQDVFSEVTGKNVQPPGITTADVRFSVKSISSRFMWMYFKHTDPPYQVHLNIDGQTAILDAEPVLEDRSPIDSTAPESGTGWKYEFSKRIALASGKHKITVALPVDDVIVEQEVVLREGANTIVLKPLYKMRMLRPYKGENFTAGVKALEITVK